MNGQDSILSKELFFGARDFEMMLEIALGLLALEGLEVSACDDTGGEGAGREEMEFIEELVLAGKENGQSGFGVEVILHEGMEVAEDFAPQEVSFVDDEDGALIAAAKFADSASQGFKKPCQGAGMRVTVKTDRQEFEEFPQ